MTATGNEAVKLSQLLTLKSDIDQTNTDQQTAINDHSSKIATLQTSVNTNTSNIETNTISIATINNTLESLQSQIDGLGSSGSSTAYATRSVQDIIGSATFSLSTGYLMQFRGNSYTSYNINATSYEIYTYLGLNYLETILTENDEHNLIIGTDRSTSSVNSTLDRLLAAINSEETRLSDTDTYGYIQPVNVTIRGTISSSVSQPIIGSFPVRIVSLSSATLSTSMISNILSYYGYFSAGICNLYINGTEVELTVQGLCLIANSTFGYGFAIFV